MALSTFAEPHLAAALLLDPEGKVRAYGKRAYRQAQDPKLRAGLRDTFKPCVGNQAGVDAQRSAPALQP